MKIFQDTHSTIKFTISLMAAMLMFSSLSHIVADMYTPSLPSIVNAFKSNATSIQFTLSIYIFSFSISQLIYGPLSDRIGRRTPLLLGIGLCIIGSVICAFAPSVAALTFGRFMQGLGVGACNSVGRSLSRDVLSGAHLAKIGSHLGMFSVFMMALAPPIGGYVQAYLGWRAVFFILFAYTSFIWIFVWKTLPETNVYLNKTATHPIMMLKNYKTLLKSKTFLGFTICSSCAYAGLISYYTSAPFLLQTVIGLTPVEFGWLSVLISAGVFISAFINSKLVMRLGIIKMVFLGNSLMLLGGLIMVASALVGYINAFVIVAPTMLFSMGAGLTFSNAFAGAFHPFPKMAGTTGALYGCLQVLGGALISTVIAIIHEKNQIPLAIILSGLGMIALCSLYFIYKEDKEKSHGEAPTY